MKVSNPEDDFRPIKLLIKLETMEEVKGFYNIFNSSYIMDALGVRYDEITSLIKRRYPTFHFGDDFVIFIKKLKESITKKEI